MKNRKVYKKLNMGTSHRMSTLRNLTKSLISNGRLVTTLPRAKALARYTEKFVITKVKNSGQSLNVIREMHGMFSDSETVQKLFAMKDRFAMRNGGYLRVVKLGSRDSDSAKMAMVEFV